MRIFAITKRIIRQFRRDRRTLALMFIAPLFVITLLWLVLNGENYEPTIALVEVPPPVATAFEEVDTLSLSKLTEGEAIQQINTQEIDAYILWKDGQLNIVHEGSDPTVTSAVQRVIQQALQSLQPETTQITPNVTFTFGAADLTLFDYIGPVLIGFFIFFFVFIIGGVSFLRERTQGTLERLLATPLKRWELVTGYLCGFGLFTIIQSIIIVTFSIYILGMFNLGSIWNVLIITLLLAITALSLGTLLSAFAKNEFQMIQFIPLVIVPQVFFTGIFHLDSMAPWLRVIGKIMPITYGSDALRDVMLRGQGLSTIQQEIFILIGFSTVFITLNILALKRHRQL